MSRLATCREHESKLELNHKAVESGSCSGLNLQVPNIWSSMICTQREAEAVEMEPQLIQGLRQEKSKKTIMAKVIEVFFFLNYCFFRACLGSLD